MENTVTVKTAELIGPALDWAVAKCEELPIRYDPMGFKNGSEAGYWVWDGSPKGMMAKIGRNYTPSTAWAQGGPIIQREGIDTHQIKRRPYETLEYRDDRAAKPGAMIIMRALSCGPGRFVRVPRKVGRYEGKWLARMAIYSNPFGWTEKDFISDTPLIAAMRCYVEFKLGAEIEVPKELL